jgi:hypothetical protein
MNLIGCEIRFVLFGPDGRVIVEPCIMRIQISPPRMSLVALHLSSYTQCRDRHFLVSCSSIAERSIAQISLPPRRMHDSGWNYGRFCCANYLPWTPKGVYCNGDLTPSRLLGQQDCLGRDTRSATYETDKETLMDALIHLALFETLNAYGPDEVRVTSKSATKRN